MTLISLSRPIINGAVEISSIEIDEPTVGAIEAGELERAKGGNDIGAMLAMLSYDTGIEADILRKVRSSDLAKIVAALTPFIEGLDIGLAGGATAQKSLSS